MWKIMSRAYRDPTADAAIAHISRDETRLKLVMDIIKLVVKLGGFRLIRRVEVEDITRRTYY